jgi:hypothetical protein
LDPIHNPYSPGAGSPPPELVGRDSILAESAILLGRIKQKRPEKSLLLTGLRGVGKTVLLNEIERIAKNTGYQTILLEAHADKSLGELIYPALRSLLHELDRMAAVGHKVKRGLAVLRSFIGGIKVAVGDVALGLDIEPATGTADSGDLEIDLPNLFMAIAEAAQERGTAIAILIDEVQYLSSKELGALIMAMHKMQQKQLPLVLLASGLPMLAGMAGESKSYAERLFNFPEVGALSESDSAKALRDPATAVGVMIENAALQEVFRLTQGYPYFLQEWGYQAWNSATTSPITLKVVQDATPDVIRRLDKNFFRVRFDRLTPGEKHFLRAMAYLGPAHPRSSDIANALGLPLKGLGPVRSKLIKKGMVYSPAHGVMAFTVPLFDDFMIRAIPEFTPA